MATASRQVTVRVLRVFTRDGNGGNHLGVHDGVLPDAVMQAAATALGYSETIFVERAADDGTVGVRIFTPTSELPFAGHPLVGATWHLAAAGETVRLRCGVGVVAGRRPDEATATIDVTYLPTVEPVPVADADSSSAVSAVSAVSAWIVGMPLPYEVVQLGSPADVAAYTLVDRPDHRLVWAGGDEGDRDTVRARFFAPGLGVSEDPATGSAAVALAATQRHDGVSSGTVTIHQGAEIGSPSRIELSWTAELTSIGGTVVEDGLRTVSVRLDS